MKSCTNSKWGFQSYLAAVESTPCLVSSIGCDLKQYHNRVLCSLDVFLPRFFSSFSGFGVLCGLATDSHVKPKISWGSEFRSHEGVRNKPE